MTFYYITIFKIKLVFYLYNKIVRTKLIMGIMYIYVYILLALKIFYTKNKRCIGGHRPVVTCNTVTGFIWF